jgi:hypothetical protein
VAGIPEKEIFFSLIKDGIINVKYLSRSFHQKILADIHMYSPPVPAHISRYSNMGWVNKRLQ